MIDLRNLLTEAINNNISDIHLKVGSPPVMRQYTALKILPKHKTPVQNQDMLSILQEITSPLSQEKFEENRYLDIIYSLQDVGRFRVHVSYQRGSLRIVMRLVPNTPPTLETLNLPPALAQFCLSMRGLILVTGATGSGKSSALAGMIEYINNHESKHIVTVEDPIEFLIKDKKSFITQQEVGIDTRSYEDSLASILRQDPDVIFIGELRDKASIDMALAASSTGHLVMASIHSTSCQETINRILVEFSGQKQEQIRGLLAQNFIAIINLRLCQRKSSGLIPAAEIVVNNARIHELIMSNNLSEIQTAIEQHKKYGAQSFDHSLMELVLKGEVDFEEALKHVANEQQFKMKLA